MNKVDRIRQEIIGAISLYRDMIEFNQEKDRSKSIEFCLNRIKQLKIQLEEFDLEISLY